VPAIIGIGVVGRPDDDVWLARGDFLVAARAPVRAIGLRAGQETHDIVLVAPRLDELAEGATGTIEGRIGVGVTAIVAGHGSIFAETARGRPPTGLCQNSRWLGSSNPRSWS
jgi:hypothetical protein